MTYSHYSNAHRFREAMGQPVHTDDMQVIDFQYDLIIEESNELLDALQRGEHYEDFDDFSLNPFFSRPDALKELADLVYVCYQFAASLGWNLDEALERVHESNMTKLVDGKPLLSEDGKVLKGPNYQPPNLSDLVS